MVCRDAGEGCEQCCPRVCRELGLLQDEALVLLGEMVAAAGRDVRRVRFQGRIKSCIRPSLR